MKKAFIYILIALILTGCGTKLLKSTSAEIEISKLSNKKLCWGLKKNSHAVPDINPGENDLLKQYNAYYLGDTTQKEIYLTFDEGYENGYTGKILDVLKNENVPACFFVTGPYLKGEPALIKRMVDEGHEVGNHTINHPSMPDVKKTENLEDEMLNLERVFFESTGKTMKFMRPPMGEHSERTLALTQSLGYKTIFWSIAYMDWDIKNQKGVDYVYNSVIDNLHNGAVILMHAVSVDNANGLEKIIKEIKSQGYTFKSLSELK